MQIKPLFRMVRGLGWRWGRCIEMYQKKVSFLWLKNFAKFDVTVVVWDMVQNNDSSLKVPPA